MFNAKAYSADSATSPLARTTIARRDPTAHDVQIDILFFGVCHSESGLPVTTIPMRSRRCSRRTTSGTR